MMTMLPCLLASILPAASSAAIVLTRRRGVPPGLPTDDLPASVLPAVPEAVPLALSFHTEPTDVRAMVVGRVEALSAHAAARGVRVGFAVEAGLMCVVAPAALRAAITEAIGCAIGAAPGGAVLVSAGRHGGRVRITVVDDGDCADEAMVTARLRPASEALALCGTSVQVRSRPGHGVTVELRVPDFAQTAHAQTAHAQPAHAQPADYATAVPRRAHAPAAACA